MDRVAMVQAGAARGWLVVGLLGLAPAFVSGSGSTASLAVSLGGILLAFMGLEKLNAGVGSMLSAAIAWRQVASLFQAAARSEDHQSVWAYGSMGVWETRGSAPIRPHLPHAHPFSKEDEGETLIEARDLRFGYGGRGQPVLDGLDLQIRAGDRLLLQGPSGGGKSTLASVLTGLRRPGSGLLLLGGLDRQSLGPEGWRQRVVSAPQFHENHVLTGTLAFNLLMGRRWPPRAEDLQQAEAVCRELGLGDLLDRMPAGLLQMVGETGWQLSHGERSRLFMARALLQDADLIVLDESFAALDPETLERCLRCARRRASTLLVIAHP
jgi:ATP-binding cassette subfamily B protein